MGLDKDNIKVDLKSHLARGAHLQELTDAWLETRRGRREVTRFPRSLHLSLKVTELPY